LELVESLERDCKDFITLCRKFDFDLEENKNSFLFRSSDYFSDYVIVDTNKSNSLRKAPFTVTNWHNLIISNLESWKNFPKRNKSLICASFPRAKTHGSKCLYLVIPFDGTEVGICSENDFWNSFERIRGKIIEPWGSKAFITNWFRLLIKSVCEMNHIDKIGDNWNEVFPLLDKIYNEQEALIIKNFFFEYGYDKDRTLLENISNFLEPFQNGFKLENKIDELLNNNIECWFEGKSYLVKYSKIREMVNQLKNL